MGEGKVLPDLSNSFTADVLQGFVKDYEAEQGEIDVIMDRARAACQPHLDRMKELVKDAAECGIEKKAFKAKLRERTHLRKAENVSASLSDRQKEVFAEITTKLSALPLFAALDADEE
jgi:hypothetical protein